MNSKAKLILGVVLLAAAVVLLCRHFSPTVPDEVRTVAVAADTESAAKEFAQKLRDIASRDDSKEFGALCARRSDVNMPDYYRSVQSMDAAAEFLKAEANKTDPGILNVYFRNPDGRRFHYTIDSRGDGGRFRFLTCYIYKE